MSLRNYLGMLAAVLLVLTAAACGDNEKPNLPPDQIIQKAVPALQNANSFHFSLDTSKLQKPLPGIFVTKADGDVLRPDKLTGSVSATAYGLPVTMQVVVDGKSQYMTDPASGKWTPMTAQLDVSQYFDPNGVSEILAGVKSLQADGTENVNNTDCYRLKGTVSAASLKKLSPEVDATGDLATTLWIGSSDFLLRRVQLTGAFFQGEPTDIVRTINMTDYNKQVKIETPVIK